MGYSGKKYKNPRGQTLQLKVVRRVRLAGMLPSRHRTSALDLLLQKSIPWYSVFVNQLSRLIWARPDPSVLRSRRPPSDHSNRRGAAARSAASRPGRKKAAATPLAVIRLTDAVRMIIYL